MCKAVDRAGCGVGWGCVPGCVRACVRARAWANRPVSVAGPVLEHRTSRREGKSSVPWEGVGEETTNLLSALLINAGEGQVGVWLKEGRSEWGGREKGRLFVGIDLCGGGGRGPPPRPSARRGRGRGRGRGRPGRPAARAAQPRGARRCPVPLNSTKKGYACS